MQTTSLQVLLESHPDAGLRIELPTGENLPRHFHITEVGRVTKSFIDCGGTARKIESCVLQTLVADDVDHRLAAGKLAGILKCSVQLDIAGDTPVEFEVQHDTISLYDLASAELHDDQVVMKLASKHTACLAPDQCGIPEPTIVSIGMSK